MTINFALPAELLTQNPRLSDALALLNRNNVDGAISLLRAQAEKHYAGSALLLSMVQYQHARYESVVDCLGRYRELEQDANGWLLNGLAQLTLGRPEQGLMALRKVLHIDWTNHNAHRYAWTALASMGLLRDAVRLLREALAGHQPLARPMPAQAPADLADVTLCAVDCVDAGLAERALRLSMEQCSFGAVKLLTSTPLACDYIDVVPIARITSSAAYSTFVARELHRFITTRHALVTQWDGYVLNASCWTREFLEYDYIGARWLPGKTGTLGPGDQYAIGNGGFSLRSIRLMRAVAKLAASMPDAALHPEDGFICIRLRPVLEHDYGLRFAPAEVADRFSFERVPVEHPTFGFHGVVNIAAGLKNPDFSRLQFLEPLIGNMPAPMKEPSSTLDIKP